MNLYKLIGFICLYIISAAAFAEEPPLNKEQALNAAIYRYLYFKTGTIPESPTPVSFGTGLDGLAGAGETVWEVKFNTPEWTEDIIFINPRTKQACIVHWGEHWGTKRQQIGQCTPVTYEGFSTKQ